VRRNSSERQTCRSSRSRISLVIPIRPISPALIAAGMTCPRYRSVVWVARP